jgi:uncharacterized RDD family membrane protein YckC/Tfp pilus assembly major pilin PilA
MALGKTAVVVPLYAGFWRRLAATFIDGIILMVPNGAVSYVFRDRPMLSLLGSIAVACVYFAGFHASGKQATPGKMAFGIKVTDVDGNRISIARALGRYFATWISTLILMIGWLLAAFTERKQALHDMIAGTLVVSASAEPADVAAGGDTMPITGGVWAVAAVLFLFPFVGGILAAIAIPAYSDYTARSKIAAGMMAISVLQNEIGATLEKKQPVTAGAIDLGSPYLQSVEVSDRGVIAARLVPGVASGGRIIFTPAVDNAGSVSWKCASTEVAARYLPMRCRG